MPCFVQDTYFLIRSVIFGFLMIAPRVVADGGSVDWSYGAYDKLGPQNWKEKYPDCFGVMQSPIDIITSRAGYEPKLQPLDFSDYENTEGVTMKLKNEGGRTAEVHFSGKELLLKGGSLPDYYILVQMHFHWGVNRSRGSEHTINNKVYAVEGHIVHRKRSFPNMTVAATQPYGLAIVGFFIKEWRRKNKNYEQLLQYFDKIQNANDEVDIPTFSIKDLLPTKYKFDYYRYQGSLTTPPCYESVIWSVAAKPVELSGEQIQRFYTLYDENHKPLVDNYRPEQDNSRRVIKTWQ